MSDAQKQLEFCIAMKIKLSEELNNTNKYKSRITLKEEITKQENLIKTWNNNIQTIKQQLGRMND